MQLMRELCSRFQEQLIHECTSVSARRSEMKELSANYHRYLDLTEQQEASDKRISHLVALLGPDRTDELRKTDDTNCLAQVLDGRSSPQALRAGLKLWVAIREYLRVVRRKSKITDIEEFFRWIGLENVTRQAIESALKRHSDVFQTSRVGRRRHVALRE